MGRSETHTTIKEMDMKSSDAWPTEGEGSTSEKLVRTTLYELIEAIRSQLPRDDDHIVAQTVYHLIKSGKIKFAGPPKYRQPWWC